MGILLIYTYLNNPNPLPPMGIICLGTYLKNKGKEVEVFDLSFSHNLQGLVRKIKEYKPQVIGLSTLTVILKTSLEVAKITKELLPSRKIVMGGLHPTAMPEDIASNPLIDIVVVGEGEKTLEELLIVFNSSGRLENVLGICFSKNGDVFKTRPREFIENVDTHG